MGLVLGQRHAVHAHDVAAGIEWIVVVESRQNTVRNLLNHKLIVGLAFLATPKDPARVPFHIVDIGLGPVELVLRIRQCKAGFYFL